MFDRGFHSYEVYTAVDERDPTVLAPVPKYADDLDAIEDIKSTEGADAGVIYDVPFRSDDGHRHTRNTSMRRLILMMLTGTTAHTSRTVTTLLPRKSTRSSANTTDVGILRTSTTPLKSSSRGHRQLTTAYVCVISCWRHCCTTSGSSPIISSRSGSANRSGHRQSSRQIHSFVHWVTSCTGTIKNEASSRFA